MRTSASLPWLVSALLAVGIGTGCNRASGSDPADANLAPVAANESAPAVAQEQYPAAAQEQYPAAPAAASYPTAATCPPGEDCTQQLVEAPQPPPPLLQYQQPVCPGPNYIWTPGYWGYADAGYYWVPGAWVLAPYIDALWTPPYWAWYDGAYRWHSGYWGPYIGYYGGINYGFGYTGLGFYGGYWNQGAFVYNRAVTNVDPRIEHHVYSRRVVNFTPFNRISYNGGRGGVNRRATPAELAVRSETRIAPLPVQMEHRQAAAANRAQFARENGGHPALAAQAGPLTVPYRAPAPAPRAWQQTVARRNQPATGGQAAERTEPGRREGTPVPEGRSVPQVAHQGVAPERGPAVARENRTAPQSHAEARPVPQQHAPEASRVPQAHAEARPAQPQRRPEVAQQYRPAPQAARPAQPQRRPEVMHQYRPAPQAARPAPQQRRPEVARQNRPAPQAARPAPQARPEARPAQPQRRPEVAHQNRPAPQAHAQARPAPARHEPAARPSSPPGGEHHRG